MCRAYEPCTYRGLLSAIWVLVAQWLERLTGDQKIAGSIPVWGSETSFRVYDKAWVANTVNFPVMMFLLKLYKSKNLPDSFLCSLIQSHMTKIPPTKTPRTKTLLTETSITKFRQKLSILISQWQKGRKNKDRNFDIWVKYFSKIWKWRYILIIYIMCFLKLNIDIIYNKRFILDSFYINVCQYAW